MVFVEEEKIGDVEKATDGGRAWFQVNLFNLVFIPE